MSRKCGNFSLKVIFHKQKLSKDGVHPQRKPCRKKYPEKTEKYHLENRDGLIHNQKLNLIKHRDRVNNKKEKNKKENRAKINFHEKKEDKQMLIFL